MSVLACISAYNSSKRKGSGFNVWYRGTTRLSGRSTAEVEREAVEWAAVGARTLADVSGARGLLSEEAFRRRFPSLQTGTYQEILAEVPDAWKDLMRGTATPRWRICFEDS